MAFLLPLLLMAVAWSAPAAAKYASLVVDAKTGHVLHSVNADTRNYPASLTKMMTLYLVFEALEKKKLTLGTRLEVSRHAARQPPSKLDLVPGSSITVKQAILALVTKSANDVAVVIAEGMAGTEREFALKMTAKARKLGMSRTTFRNASGLYNRGNLSTARDMATLARALMRDFPQDYHYFSTTSFTYDGTTYPNHNELLGHYKGTDGIKTGYLHASGFNLVASVERNGTRLIGVVFGGRTSRSRDKHMMTLLSRAFDKEARAAATRMADGRRAVDIIEPAPPKPMAAIMAVAAADGDSSGASAATVTDAVATDGDADSDRRTLGDWAVQVGAYRTRNPAYEQAREAVSAAPSLLSDGIIKIVPLRKKRHVLYRARVAGLEKKAAYHACSTLERKGMDCLVVVMKGVQVASNP